MKTILSRLMIYSVMATLLLPTSNAFATVEISLSDNSDASLVASSEDVDGKANEITLLQDLPDNSLAIVQDNSQGEISGQVAPSAIVQPSPAVVADSVQSTGIEVTPRSAEQSLYVIGHDIIISEIAFDAESRMSYLELYNTSAKLVYLEGLQIRITYVDSSDSDVVCEIAAPDGYLNTKSHVGFAYDLDQASIDRGAYSFSCDVRNIAFVESIEVIRNGSVYERLKVQRHETSQYIRSSMTNEKYLSGDFYNDFRQRKANDSSNYLVELYRPPDTLPIRVIEFLPVTRNDCTQRDVEMSKAGCRKYIKIQNTSDDNVDISSFVMRSGTAGGTTTSQYKSQLSGIIAPDEVAVLYETIQRSTLYFNSGNATVWFEDALGLKSYDASVTVYPNADTAANRGKAWAYYAETDRWNWALPSPDTASIDVTPIPAIDTNSSDEVTKQCDEGWYLYEPTGRCRKLAVSAEKTPCKDGQYRSEETGRCRSIALAGSTLKPCREDQYRSEETNRCRSIAATAAVVLKPCADDQFRNPATNRCKNIASTDDVLAPCKDGWERNAQTNRCRKVVSATVPLADFPVQTAKSTERAILGWWVAGGVAVAALGYAVWEWRHEISMMWQSVYQSLRRKR